MKRGRPKTLTDIVEVRFTPEQLEYLTAVAKFAGVPRNAVIRQMVQEGVNRREANLANPVVDLYAEEIQRACEGSSNGARA